MASEKDRFHRPFPVIDGCASLSHLHPVEPDVPAVRQPRGDVAGGKAGFALRHLFLRAAQGLPPRRPLRRARQRSADDLLDLFETQNQFGELLFAR